MKAAGVKLTRAQESWVCVAQSLRSEFIPEGLDLKGPKWPQDNIGAQNLWMYKPITARGEKMVADAAKAAEAASAPTADPKKTDGK